LLFAARPDNVKWQVSLGLNTMKFGAIIIIIIIIIIQVLLNESVKQSLQTKLVIHA